MNDTVDTIAKKMTLTSVCDNPNVEIWKKKRLMSIMVVALIGWLTDLFYRIWSCFQYWNKENRKKAVYHRKNRFQKLRTPFDKKKIKLKCKRNVKHEMWLVELNWNLNEYCKNYSKLADI